METIQKELVVLVNSSNKKIGTAQKATVHTKDTPLHRGFSLFLFRDNGDVLMTKRAATKKTFPAVWTNSVCGHPADGESVITAAARRVQEELHIEADNMHVFSKYRYRFFDKNGIVENEICPILLGHTEGSPKPSKEEVSDWKWMSWSILLQDMKRNADRYSPWSIEEAQIIESKRAQR